VLANSAVFLFEGFRVDRRAGVLFRCEHSGAFVPIGIGSRALDVLGVLVERAGDLVSRDQIIAAVWPLTAVGDNNLNMQIAALRRVFDEGRTGRSSIQTVAGRGYRFAVSLTRVEADLRWDTAAVSLSPPRAADPPAATSIEAPHDQAERRQITALACELIVPSGQTEAGNLEDLREVVGAFRQCISESAARHEGFVFSSLGNTVLALFGYPAAHENGAEYAVRAGLELCISVRTLKTHADFPTRCRVGIETGTVIVSDRVGGSRDQMVVDDAPMLAARLQASAQPDTVTIGPTTRRLIGGLFDYRDLGAIDIGGVSGPLPAWQVLRTSAVESRFEALRGSALTPLVGRNEEIDQLLRRWSRAKAGDGQVVLVAGEPGIGKSRLCAELEQRLHTETHLRRRYFCSPYHRDSVLSPFIGQLGRAAGFARDDPPATRLGKLEALIGPVAAGEDVAFLANLLSLPPSQRYPLPNLSPLRMRERTLQALIRQTRSLGAAAAGPDGV
jgi:class 3 adenylate cyclase